MGLTHQIVALVIERRVQEEPVVLEGKVLAHLANAALAQGEQLLTFGETRTVTAHSLKAIGINLVERGL